jgi:hypothetical protein
LDFPDAIAIIPGILGIVSFVIGLNSKLSAWKKYTILTAIGLDGFAIGRVSIIFSSRTGVFPPEYLLIITIVLILVIAAMAIVYFGLKLGYPLVALIVPILILAEVLPRVLDFYGKINK